jgi:hypothetical protein
MANDDLGDPTVLEALKAARNDEQRLAIERASIRPTVFPLDADESPSFWKRLFNRRVD